MGISYHLVSVSLLAQQDTTGIAQLFNAHSVLTAVLVAMVHYLLNATHVQLLIQRFIIFYTEQQHVPHLASVTINTK